MRRIVIPRTGNADVIRIESAPDPIPARDEVVVTVRAAGLNFADVLARQGLYPDAPTFPACLGYEFAGEVTATGMDVDTGLTGLRVFGLSRFNGQAEQVRVPRDQLFVMPENLDFAQAAAIPVNYLTAWLLLVVMGSLCPEDTVLIHNAGGGVGLAALDIARHIGARTLGTASPGKHGFLRERGLDEAIDYRNHDWEAAVARLTDGRGVELVIDPIGGRNFGKSYRALRSTGRLGMFGVSSAAGLGGRLSLFMTALGMPLFHPVSLMNGNRSVFGVNMGHLWHEPEKVTRWMNRVLEGVEAGWVRPHVDRQFSFEQAAEAHRYLQARRNTGKVILVP